MRLLLTEEAAAEANMADEIESAGLKQIEDRERSTVLRGIVLSAMMADLQEIQTRKQVCHVATDCES